MKSISTIVVVMEVKILNGVIKILWCDCTGSVVVVAAAAAVVRHPKWSQKMFGP